METSDTITNLAAALATMQPHLLTISKSGENTFAKYTYATLEDYIKGTRDVLAEHGFSIISSASQTHVLPDRTTSRGGIEHAVQITLSIRLIHTSGEWIQVKSVGEGQDALDKAVYKAVTGARKYGIASLLGLATSDDPEEDETKTNIDSEEDEEIFVANIEKNLATLDNLDSLKAAYYIAIECDFIKKNKGYKDRIDKVAKDRRKKLSEAKS